MKCWCRMLVQDVQKLNRAAASAVAHLRLQHCLEALGISDDQPASNHVAIANGLLQSMEPGSHRKMASAAVHVAGEVPAPVDIPCKVPSEAAVAAHSIQRVALS